MTIKVSGTLENPNNPRILYNNLAVANNGTITSSSDASATFAKENVLDPATYNFWQPSTQDSYINVDFGVDTVLNYIAIRGHNCGTQGNTINILSADLPLPVTSGLNLWFDGSDSSTITTSGGNVSQWGDKSGNDNHLIQSTGANQPVYSSTTMNGKNTVYFDGGKFMTTTSNVTLNDDITVFIVINNLDTLGANANLFRDTAQLGSVTYINSASSDRYAMFNGVNLQSLTSAVNDSAVLTSVFNGATSELRRNGTQIASGNSGGNSVTDTLQLCNALVDGEVAEFIVFDRVLTPSEITDVEDYLDTKWVSGGLVFNTIDTITPTNDDIIIFLFDDANASQYRVQFTGGSVPTVGNIFFGTQLTIPQRIYGGVTPISFAKKTAIRPNVSDGGQFLGRSKISQGVQLKANFEHITADFARSNLLPFFEDALLNPFFFAWRPEQYPDELCYVQTTSDLSATNMGMSNLMSFSINAMGRDN